MQMLLYSLITCTMYHINISLAILLQQVTIKRGKQKMLIYAISVNLLVIVFEGFVFAIFMMPKRVDVKWVLVPNFISRFLMEVIYTVTVVRLWSRIRKFNSKAMKQERRSIMLQFIAFFISSTTQWVYSAFQFHEKIASFEGALWVTLVGLLSNSPPIVVILHAHYQTFKDIRPHE